MAMGTRLSPDGEPYEQLIVEGIKGLPPELLAEIAAFVYFVRRATEPQEFE